MDIRLFSDLHNEFSRGNEYHIPELPNDSKSILVLAGDIDFKHHPLAYANSLASRFRYVIYVAGNHDLYGGNITKFYDKFKDGIEHDNVAILQNETLIVDDVMFVGATLWTDFGDYDPLTIWNWNQMMRDSKKITHGNSYSKLTAAILMFEHKETLRYIQETVSNVPEGIRSIVAVSHHSPSYSNGNKRFRGNMSEAYFHSNLDWLIPEFDCWLFGHTHYPVDHMLGDTRVISNPKGYGHKSILFDPMKIITV
jgi:predicted phosphodiesterase